MPYSRIISEQLMSLKSVFEGSFIGGEDYKGKRVPNKKAGVQVSASQRLDAMPKIDIERSNNPLCLFNTNYAYRLKTHSIFNKSNFSIYDVFVLENDAKLQDFNLF